MRPKKKSNTPFKMLGVFSMGLMVIFVFFPIAWIVSTSLKTEAEALRPPIRWIPRQPTIQSYLDMWILKPFGLYFLNSTIVSGLTAFLSTFIGGLAGYGFSRFAFKARKTLIGAFLATQMISGVLVIGPYFKMMAKLGLYDTRLSLIIAFVTICLPFSTWMSKGFFDTIPRELDEAAMIDGCSRFKTFIKIIAPLATPGMVATLIFAFLLAWQDLLWAICLTSTDSTRTVTLGIALCVGEFRIRWPMLTAAAIIGSTPVIVLYILLQRFLVQGLLAGAVKQ